MIQGADRLGVTTAAGVKTDVLEADLALLAALQAQQALGHGPRLCHTGGMPARVSTDGTDTTPATTETYICEVHVPFPMTVTGISLFNGSVAAGNITVSLADGSGVPITAAKSASTAMSGTDTYQRIAFAAPYTAIGPAKYLVLVQFSSTSARFNTHIFGDFGASKKTGETYGTFTTVTAPTTFTTGQGPIASLY